MGDKRITWPNLLCSEGKGGVHGTGGRKRIQEKKWMTLKVHRKLYTQRNMQTVKLRCSQSDVYTKHSLALLLSFLCYSLSGSFYVS